MPVESGAVGNWASDRPLGLPDYRRPPLVEVVLSAQFVPLPGLTIAHLGLLWDRFRVEFSHVEERPPLGQVVETFDDGLAPQAEVSFKVMDRPPSPRLWFLKDDRSELIQVQENRLIHNWRKMGAGDAYPRYERIRDRFRSELVQFESFLSDEGLGELTLDQAEVTYVNHIVAGDGWTTHSELHRVFCQWSTLESSAGTLEDASLSARYVLTDEGGDPIGRLHTGVRPARRSADGTPMYIMELTARGAPLLGPAADGVLAFMDLGRAAIVRMFTVATTPTMHEIWGRRQ